MKLVRETEDQQIYAATGKATGLAMMFFGLVCLGIVGGVWSYHEFVWPLLVPMFFGVLFLPAGLGSLFTAEQLELRRSDKTICYRRRCWRKAASTEQRASFDDVNAVVVSYSLGRGPNAVSSYHLRLHLSTENLEMSPAAQSGLGKAFIGAAEALGYDSSEYRQNIDTPVNADDAREKGKRLARFGGFPLIDRIEDEERVYSPEDLAAENKEDG